MTKSSFWHRSRSCCLTSLGRLRIGESRRRESSSVHRPSRGSLRAGVRHGSPRAEARPGDQRADGARLAACQRSGIAAPSSSARRARRPRRRDSRSAAPRHRARPDQTRVTPHRSDQPPRSSAPPAMRAGARGRSRTSGPAVAPRSGGRMRGGAGAEDQPFEQRVAREPVGAVHAGAGDLARPRTVPGIDVRPARSVSTPPTCNAPPG